ncbi:MAG: hypothetical protein JWQ34_1239 [Mucilaginibacter sp.]|nr:hypothetical protein [Mucilaginibacter sp.]
MQKADNGELSAFCFQSDSQKVNHFESPESLFDRKVL